MAGKIQMELDLREFELTGKFIPREGIGYSNTTYADGRQVTGIVYSPAHVLENIREMRDKAGYKPGESVPITVIIETKK